MHSRTGVGKIVDLPSLYFLEKQTQGEGKGAEGKREKTKIIPSTQPKARAKCPKLLTPVAGLIFETKNREIFLERFFGRGITAREQVSRAVILARF